MYYYEIGVGYKQQFPFVYNNLQECTAILKCSTQFVLQYLEVTGVVTIQLLWYDESKSEIMIDYVFNYGHYNLRDCINIYMYISLHIQYMSTLPVVLQFFCHSISFLSLTTH